MPGKRCKGPLPGTGAPHALSSPMAALPCELLARVSTQLTPADRKSLALTCRTAGQSVAASWAGARMPLADFVAAGVAQPGRFARRFAGLRCLLLDGPAPGTPTPNAGSSASAITDVLLSELTQVRGGGGVRTQAGGIGCWRVSWMSQ